MGGEAAVVYSVWPQLLRLSNGYSTQSRLLFALRPDGPKLGANSMNQVRS